VWANKSGKQYSYHHPKFPRDFVKVRDENKVGLELHLGEIRGYFFMATHCTVYCAKTNCILEFRFRVEISLTIVLMQFTMKAFYSI
jgi:hypothetical protein